MIYLHLGVHKTATTYLQDLLALNRDRIYQGGRVYWTRAQILPCFEALLNRWNRRSLRVLYKFFGEAAVRFPIKSWLAVDKPVIISEENILGGARDCLEGAGLYTKTRHRLGHVAAVFRNEPTEIWICLREYSAFLASAYAESLRHGYDCGIRTFVERNSAVHGSWAELIETIHDLFPTARIVVWRFEEFSDLKDDVIEGLSGLKADELQRLPSGNIRPSASRKAIEMQSEALSGLTEAQRVRSMAEFEERFPASSYPERFDPWSETARQAWSESYAEDLRAIEQKQYVEFLQARSSNDAL